MVWSVGCVVENVPILYIKSAIILIIYVIFDRYGTIVKEEEEGNAFCTDFFFFILTYSHKYHGFLFHKLGNLLQKTFL